MWLDMYYVIKYADLAAWPSVNNGSTSSGGNTFSVPEYKNTSGSIKASVSCGAGNTSTVNRCHGGFCGNVVKQTTTIASSASYKSLNFMVGTGTTPATSTDYKMEAQITSGISCTSTYNYSTASGVIHRNATISNTSTDSITITEIGISAADYIAGQILIYREVLEEPIVLEGGESFTFTLTDKYPMPE